METPQQTTFAFSDDCVTPTPYKASAIKATASFTGVVPNAPKKQFLSVSRIRVSEQDIPEGYVRNKILIRRGLPPIRKIVF